jgi:hypothetical protein
MRHGVIVSVALALPLLLLFGEVIGPIAAAGMAIVLLIALYTEMARVQRRRG